MRVRVCMCVCFSRACVTCSLGGVRARVCECVCVSSFLVIQFFVLTLLIISMTFVLSLTQMFCHCRLFDIEHNSFHFGLCGRKFVLLLVGQCPGICTIGIAGSTHEL